MNFNSLTVAVFCKFNALKSHGLLGINKNEILRLCEYYLTDTSFDSC